MIYFGKEMTFGKGIFKIHTKLNNPKLNPVMMTVTPVLPLPLEQAINYT